MSSGSLYDKEDREARSFEGHFKAFLRGKIRTNRKRLADFLIPLFQKQVYRELGMRISRAQIRVGFEREERVLSSSKQVNAEFRIIKYHAKHHVAERLPPQSFTLTRKRRHKRSKRKASKRHSRKRSKRARRKRRNKRSKRGRRRSRRE